MSIRTDARGLGPNPDPTPDAPPLAELATAWLDSFDREDALEQQLAEVQRAREAAHDDLLGRLMQLSEEGDAAVVIERNGRRLALLVEVREDGPTTFTRRVEHRPIVAGP